MNLEKFLELQYKDKKNNFNYNSNNLIQIFNLLSISAIEISKIISNPEQSELSNKSGATNSDGDETKNLDLKADSIIRQNLSSADIKWYASEEEQDFVFLNKNGSFTICIDPLDGSSNIETNAPIGTIFGIYKSRINPNETILQSGDNLIASGFFIYGPRLKLIFSIGNGTSVFQLNQNDEFVLIQEAIKIPQNTNELSINFSNYSFWPSLHQKLC